MDRRVADESDASLFWPAEPYRDDRSILVAGCGTSQAAKVALRWPRAQVVGIDVSATSIEQTDRLRRKHRIDNLHLQQLPLERAAELGRVFEHVICTGVLHHLSDPDRGLRALRDVLAPDGAMHLMVYAPYGRAGVYLLQDYCRRLRIGSTATEIRELAASLQALPPDHPLRPLLRHAPDFSNEAGLADALLHPQDRAYSVPQLMEFLADAGLEFGRWVRQAAYLPQCGALASSPHQALLARLSLRRAVRRGRTVPRHDGAPQCRGLSARPTTGTAIDFEGDAWLGYVPLRVSDTIVVQERLPPDAAAVLINKAHTYTDIYLPISATRSACSTPSTAGARSARSRAAGAARRRAGAVRGLVVVRSGRIRRVAAAVTRGGRACRPPGRARSPQPAGPTGRE